MIQRSLVLFWSALSLVCCDKPGSSNVRDDDSPAATAMVRHRHALREHAPPPPTLHTLLESASEIAAPAAREKAIADVAWSAIETDPLLANKAFQQLPAESPEKVRLIQHFAMCLAARDPDEALAWAASLTTEPEVAAAQGHIALAIAETDPLRAANLLSESGIAGREFDVAVVQVIQRWAAQSAPNAAAWVVMFPPGAAREAGLKIIADRWLQSDAPAAFGWFGDLKDPELRKETARAMQGVILQQPKHIRDAWLQQADANTQNELEQQRGQAIRDVGDNIPPPAK